MSDCILNETITIFIIIIIIIINYSLEQLDQYQPIGGSKSANSSFNIFHMEFLRIFHVPDDRKYLQSSHYLHKQKEDLKQNNQL